MGAGSQRANEYQATRKMQFSTVLAGRWHPVPATAHSLPRPKSPQAGELQGFHTSHSLERQLDSLLYVLPAYSGHQGLYVWVGVDLD